MKAVYSLPYHQTVGFAQSIFDLLDADVTVPDYTILCKRSADEKFPVLRYPSIITLVLFT
jgi:hypothetical protein